MLVLACSGNRYARRLERRGQLALLLCLALVDKGFEGFRAEIPEEKICTPAAILTDRAHGFAAQDCRQTLVGVILVSPCGLAAIQAQKPIRSGSRHIVWSALRFLASLGQNVG